MVVDGVCGGGGGGPSVSALWRQANLVPVVTLNVPQHGGQHFLDGDLWVSSLSSIFTQMIYILRCPDWHIERRGPGSTVADLTVACA